MMKTTPPSEPAIIAAGTRSFAEAAKWSYVMDGGRQVMTTVITFILAAILGPEAFGIAAMALAYVLFIQMLQQQGLGAALIQKKDLEARHLDAAFWAISAISVILTGLSLILAGWWSSLNDLPELRAVVMVLSIVIPLQGLTLVQESVLRRDLDFRSLAIRTNVAVVLAGIVAVVMAFAGAGVWALVVQQIVSAAAGLLLLWGLSSWRPRFRFSRQAFNDLLAFSSLSFVATIAVFIGNRGDVLLIGLFFKPAAAGIYYFGNRLITMVTDLSAKALQGAALPELSRYQNDLTMLGRRMLTILSTSALIALPLLALVAGASADLVALIGTEKWGPAVIVLQILALVGAVRAVTLFTGPMLQAMGRPGLHARLSWMAAVLSAGSFVAVGFWFEDATLLTQVRALSLSRLAVHVVFLVAFLAPIVRLLPIGLRQLAASMAGPAIAGAAGFAVVVVIQAATGGLPVLVRIGLEGAIAAGIMALILLTFDPRARALATTVQRKLAPNFGSSL